MAEKTYYYIKLEETYFGSKFQKALRGLPGGADMLIVYLKMQLRYAKDEGYVVYDGLYPSIEEEIAQDVDENIDTVRMAIAFMGKYGYFEKTADNLFYLPEMQSRIGSKTDVAIRVAKHRALKESKKTALLQCNKKVTIDAYNSNSNSLSKNMEECLKNLCKSYRATRNNKKESRKTYYEYLLGNKKDKEQNITYKFNHIQIQLATRQYILECKEKKLENDKVLLLSTFLNGRLIDYIEKTIPIYEQSMKKQFGDNWNEIVYDYTVGE